MYIDIPVWLSILFLVGGLYLVAKSADVFIDGAATVATALGVNPFVIGMVVIGFGTSAPELFVSALSGLSGHSELSLGNAFGSCVFNIGCILGVAALIRPLSVKPSVVWVASPVLFAISLFSGWLVSDAEGFSRSDGIVLLALFAVVLPMYCWYDQHSRGGAPKVDVAKRDDPPRPGIWKAVAKVSVGLVVLVGSSHMLVWGAVDMAKAFGVSELMIGLTVVAAGTSLPELASAIAAARKGEHEFVLGNIVGSNLFNVLAVVGLAGALSPFGDVKAGVLSRDLPTMAALSLSMLVFGANWRRPSRRGRIGRFKGLLWVLAFTAYLVLTIVQEGGFSAR